MTGTTYSKAKLAAAGPKSKADKFWMTLNWIRKSKSGNRWLKLVLCHLQTLFWQVLYLTQHGDLHGQDKDEKEREQLEKVRPQITTLYAWQDFLIACDKPISDLLPIHDECVQLHCCKLETLIGFVTPVKRAVTSTAQQYLSDTNHTLLDFLTPAQPPPC